MCKMEKDELIILMNDAINFRGTKLINMKKLVLIKDLNYIDNVKFKM